MKDITFTLRAFRQAHSFKRREELVTEIVTTVAQEIKQSPNDRWLFRFFNHATVGVVTEISQIGTDISVVIDGYPFIINPDNLVDIEPSIDDDENN